MEDKGMDGKTIAAIVIMVMTALVTTAKAVLTLINEGEAKDE